MKRAFTLFVKTGPACNAGCISCPSGRKAVGEIEKIPLLTLEMWKRILDRALEQGHVISAVLHYLNEPMLNLEMPDIIRYTKSKGVITNMSTNGTYPERLQKCIEAGLDFLIFSVSGWTQEIHERSHKNTDIEAIKRSMKNVSKIRKKGQFVRVGWHDYLYNRHEQTLMREFSMGLGFKFTPYQTSVLPLEIVLNRFLELDGNPNVPPLPAERDLITKLPEAKILCMQRRHFTCVLQQRMFAVDGNGMLYNCCAKGNANGNRRESIFDIDLESFNKMRFNDDDCLECKSIGGHVYGMQKYRSPLSLGGDFVRFCEDVYRSLGIGGYLHFMTKLFNSLTYERPATVRDTSMDL